MTRQQSEMKAASPGTERTLTVIEVLAAGPEGMTLTSIASTAGIPIATCAGILYSLEARGYATRQVIGRSHFWTLTLALYSITSPQVNKLNLAASTRNDLQELAGRVGFPAHVGVVSGTKLVYLAKEAGSSFIQFDTFPGKVVPFNHTALGRAVAAHLPEDRLAPLLAGLEPGAGPKAAPVDADEFRELLRTVRESGFAIEDQEEVEGVACIAAPVFDSSGGVVAAIGVTGIADRLVGKLHGDVTRAVIDTAASISRQLGAPDVSARPFA